MTREEAILILQEEAEFLYGDFLPGNAPYNKTAFDMAIEALSAPQTDLINRGRADAIEAIQNAYCKPCKERGDDYSEVRCRVCEYDNAIMQIDALPSADAEWIPCSERLPKRDELVLVTYKTTDRIHLCRYLDDGSENPWWSYIDDCCAWNNVVLAWMPLPKPYRKDGEA